MNNEIIWCNPSFSQETVKESYNSQRTLESQLLTMQSKDSSKDFRVKELEGSKRALEQENELLRKKVGKINSVFYDLFCISIACVQ